MKLKEMVPSERPREKMLKNGAKALSNAELLAVMLRTGTLGTNVLDLSMKLLEKAHGNLELLAGMSVEKLCCVEGIGKGKALTIAAAVEFGKRLASAMVEGAKIVINTPEDAAKLLSGLYSTDNREECWCLLLKRNRCLINSVKISDGGETMTQICIKSIVRNALDTQASAIILSHNHPGGNPKPSSADIKETMKLRRALETFDISLMDHIIISGRECYSFSMEKGFVY